MNKNRYAIAAAVLFLAACSRPRENKVVRLVDIFDTAKIEGTPDSKSLAPKAMWDFAKPEKGAEEWKAGDGVSGLKIVDGKLIGRSTTDFPIIYVSRPKAVDTSD